MTVVLILWVLCVGFAALIAHAKGRSVGWFALAGLAFGVFGVLWSAFATSAADLAAKRAAGVDAARQERDRLMLREDLAQVPRPTRRDVKPLHWPE
jgi:hypothetical protein